MTSLRESVKQSWVDKFGVGIDPSLDWPDKWAEGYIKELEEQSILKTGPKMPAVYWEGYFDGRNKMLALLRGTTK